MLNKQLILTQGGNKMVMSSKVISVSLDTFLKSLDQQKFQKVTNEDFEAFKNLAQEGEDRYNHTSLRRYITHGYEGFDTKAKLNFWDRLQTYGFLVKQNDMYVENLDPEVVEIVILAAMKKAGYDVSIFDEINDEEPEGFQQDYLIKLLTLEQVMGNEKIKLNEPLLPYLSKEINELGKKKFGTDDLVEWLDNYISTYLSHAKEDSDQYVEPNKLSLFTFESLLNQLVVSEFSGMALGDQLPVLSFISLYKSIILSELAQYNLKRIKEEKSVINLSVFF